MWLAKEGDTNAQLIDDRLTGYIESLIAEGYIETTENQDPLMVMQADGTWAIDFMLQAKALTTAVEETLDTKAQEFRYDDIKSARSYTGYLNAYQAEATTLAVWASECWSYMDTLEANLLNTKEVIVDTVTTIEPDPIKTEIEWVDFMPTVDELLASLPVYVGVV